ncbi:MAG: hypothetical protein ACI8ZN_000324 [Bacteroidia bacterium]|jgi:uncharacterized protein YqeY
MALKETLSEEIKLAMKAKDAVKLRGLRLIKAAIMLLDSAEGGKVVSPEDEMNTLAKLAKQRRDSLTLYQEQNRPDLAQKEEEELVVIESFLPKQLSNKEVEAEVKAIIQKVGATTMADMGKVMGMASSKLKGKADGKAISLAVKQLLS